MNTQLIIGLVVLGVIGWWFWKSTKPTAEEPPSKTYLPGDEVWGVPNL